MRQAYGDAAMDAANERMAGMSQEEWSDAKALEAAILEQLTAAKATGDPTGEAARKLCAMHARWLQMHWGEGAYSPAAHAALAEGYVADPRFMAYYDEAAGEGATASCATPHRLVRRAVERRGGTSKPHPPKGANLAFSQVAHGWGMRIR